MKWIHIIGVSGKATSLVAKFFKDKGWFVTGSDAQFFPPASTYLQDHQINTAQGYNYKHLTKEYWIEKLETPNPKPQTKSVISNQNSDSKISNTKFEIPNSPDLCIMMSFLSEKNKEYRYAKLHNIPVWPYAKALGEYLIKENSVVVVGTAGKTTTTALIAFLLIELGLDPSFMIGAETNNFEESIYEGSSDWSVIEGDEYHNPNENIEGKPKFMEYKPKFLVITNIGHEHQDIFPTQEEYNSAFQKLVASVPSEGVIIARAGDKNIDDVITHAKCRVIRYGSNHAVKADYYSSYHHSLQEGPEYEVLDHEKKSILRGKMNLLDVYNTENILAAFILIKELIERELLPAEHIKKRLRNEGIPADAVALLFKEDLFAMFQSLIQEFAGVKKRLEIVHSSEDLVILDDFGVVPHRAKRTLTTVAQHYPGYKIVAVFEPNSASRPLEKETFNKLYHEVFKNTELVVIPELSSQSELVDQEEMVSRLSLLGYAASASDNKTLVSSLVRLLEKEKDVKHVIVFFSSYRLTEMVHTLADHVR